MAEKHLSNFDGNYDSDKVPTDKLGTPLSWILFSVLKGVKARPQVGVSHGYESRFE